MKLEYNVGKGDQVISKSFDSKYGDALEWIFERDQIDLVLDADIRWPDGYQFGDSVFNILSKITGESERGLFTSYLFEATNKDKDFAKYLNDYFENGWQEWEIENHE